MLVGLDVLAMEIQPDWTDGRWNLVASTIVGTVNYLLAMMMLSRCPTQLTVGCAFWTARVHSSDRMRFVLTTWRWSPFEVPR
jgi:hypothetical protein